MEIGRVLRVTSRNEWRGWLKDNFQNEKEVWLAYLKKHTGKERISYNDAVEEALCFGWIDSIAKSLDKDTTVQRFSPRNAKSGYSQPNIERLTLLTKQGLLHPSVRPVVENLIKQTFVFPADILRGIKKHKKAWKHYQQFSPAYQRIRIAYIEGARKRPEEFKKRLNNFITTTEKNRQIGFGGIEKYY